MEKGGKEREKFKVRYTCKGGDDACDKIIKPDESSIQCEACTNWFHPGCQGLTQGAFDAISEYDLFWVCVSCQKQFREAQSIKVQVEKQLSEVEARIGNRVEEVKYLVEKVIDRKVDDGMKRVEVKIGESSTALKKAVQEKHIDRSKNLILHNIPESVSEDSKTRKDHDVAEIGKVVEALCGRESLKVTEAFRLNRTRDIAENEADRRPRLLIVKFEKETEAEYLLKKRFGLREVGYPNVYITKDLSKEERERQ